MDVQSLAEDSIASVTIHRSVARLWHHHSEASLQHCFPFHSLGSCSCSGSEGERQDRKSEARRLHASRAGLSLDTSYDVGGSTTLGSCVDAADQPCSSTLCAVFLFSLSPLGRSAARRNSYACTYTCMLVCRVRNVGAPAEAWPRPQEVQEPHSRIRTCHHRSPRLSPLSSIRRTPPFLSTECEIKFSRSHFSSRLD